MAISLDRKTPGVFGIIFSAALSIALGALLAVIHLASQPVTVADEVPKEPVEGALYFIKGDAPNDSVGALERKRDSLQDSGAEVVFTEGELNAWSAEIFKQTEIEESEKASSVLIIAGRPNFRFVDKELQLGMENELVFFGNTAPLVLQGRGGFERVGDKLSFRPTEAYFGGLPLHRLPAGVLEAVAKRFVPSAPEEAASVLTRASAIGVTDGQLIVRLR